MDNFEEMKNEIISEMMESGCFTVDQAKTAEGLIYKVGTKYKVEKKSTEIIVYQGMPNELKEYLAILKMEGRKEGTLYNYRKILTKFFQHVRKQPGEITHRDIWSFLLTYQESREKPLSNRTMEQYRGFIRYFFNWMQDIGYITKNPAKGMQPIKYEKRKKPSLTRRDLVMVENACTTPREKALVHLMYATGCRACEIVKMKKEDINWHSKEIAVMGKGSIERVVMFNDAAEIELKEYIDTRKDESPYLFVSERGAHGVTTNSIWKWIKKIYMRTGPDKLSAKMTPHIIRHTTGTQALISGMPVTSVQKLLGHKNLETTTTYLDMQQVELQSDYVRCVV